jgi:hypothetical protein
MPLMRWEKEGLQAPDLLLWFGCRGGHQGCQGCLHMRAWVSPPPLLLLPTSAPASPCLLLPTCCSQVHHMAQEVTHRQAPSDDSGVPPRHSAGASLPLVLTSAPLALNPCFGADLRLCWVSVGFLFGSAAWQASRVAHSRQ